MNLFIYFILLACINASTNSDSSKNPKIISLEDLRHEIVDISKIPTREPRKIKFPSNSGRDVSPTPKYISPHQHLLEGRRNYQKKKREPTEEEIELFKEKLERALKSKN